MSRQINQPINQVKLTNVAVVKYSYGGKRFEIACYRNKVMDYRSGFERDLSEVLQSERIFTNVSKGQFAKSSELEQVFGTRDESAIARTILEKGDFQLSDLERQQLLESTLSQIATQISVNCVNPETRRSYTVSQIRTALSNYHLQPHKPIKKQYLDAIKFLKQSSFPIERAKMELAIRYPANLDETIQMTLDKLAVDVVKQKSGPGLVVVHVDPSLYRDLSDLATSLKGGRLEILQQIAVFDASGDGGSAQPISSADYQPSSVPAVSRQAAESANQESDEEQQELLRKLQSLGIVRAEQEDGPNDSVVPPNRKQLRQQQKKGKKAQRRNQDTLLEVDKNELGAVGSKKEDGEGDSQSNTDRITAGATVIKSCNTCGGSFSSLNLYRAHFRSDWHRFNQKLKLKGIPAVSEEEFRLCDADTFFGSADND